MQAPTVILFALLTGSRVRLGLWLVIFGFLVALLLLAWSFRLSRNGRNGAIILFTGVMPLLLLTLIWPQFRRPIFASLVATLLLSFLSKSARHALHLPLMLFTGLIPLFLLIGVEDMYWSAGFLLVYLGLVSLESRLGGHADTKDELFTNPADRAWYLLYCTSVGFLWILLFAALLWYVPEPETINVALRDKPGGEIVQEI